MDANYSPLLLALFELQKLFTPVAVAADRNESAGVLYQLDDGRTCAFFEITQGGSSRPKGRIWSACETASTSESASASASTLTTQPSSSPTSSPRFGAPRELFASESARFRYRYMRTPRIVDSKKGTYLYFSAADDTSDEKWGRAEVSRVTGNVGAIQWLTGPEHPKDQQNAWLYPHALNTGEILLTYETVNSVSVANSTSLENRGEARFALSPDGVKFDASRKYQAPARLSRIGEFGDGAWIFVYQEGQGQNAMDQVRITRDRGASFSEAIAISSRPQTRDTAFVRRQDAALDAYYVVWHGRGYSIHRRKIDASGTLGQEERLTDDTLDAQKPNPIRRKDGSLLIVFNKMTPNARGEMTSDLVTLRLPADAP